MTNHPSTVCILNREHSKCYMIIETTTTGVTFHVTACADCDKLAKELIRHHKSPFEINFEKQ